MVNSESDAFHANAAHNRGLRDELYARVAEAGLGGNEKSRERHTSRGKLLPRDTVDRLLDPGSPFLATRPPAASALYGGETPGEGRIAGRGRVAGRPAMLGIGTASGRE